MFHRKKATPGKFMIRLRIPNGIITSDHMRYFSKVVDKYGPDIGVIDITTRMNIQLRSPPLEDCADIITSLQGMEMLLLLLLSLLLLLGLFILAKILI
jgi:ferredoxin-nitrite reductase